MSPPQGNLDDGDMSPQGNLDDLFTLDDVPDPAEFSAEDWAFADSCLNFHGDDPALHEQPPHAVDNNNINVALQEQQPHVVDDDDDNNNIHVALHEQPHAVNNDDNNINAPVEEWDFSDLVADVNSLQDLLVPPPLPANFPQPLPELPPVQPRQERKRTRWTTEEHEQFLKGLKKYQRGDWKSISREFVTTKSPNQIASHAQKYYLHLDRSKDDDSKKRKRKSIHDVTTEHIPDPSP